MNMPRRPKMLPALIIRHEGVLTGEIKLGEVFAWRPDDPYARELTIVSKIEDGMISSWDMKYQKYCTNTEETFREACYRTQFNLFPINPPTGTQCKPT